MSHSASANGSANTNAGRNAWKTTAAPNGTGASPHAPDIGTTSSQSGDGGSPTLPNLAIQPTLNSLINSSLSNDASTPVNDVTSASEMSSAAASGTASSADEMSPISPSSAIPPVGNSDTPPIASAPRVGDSAKRMVGAALGLKHPGIPSRRTLEPAETLQKAMGGLVIAE